jgi:uncharacterized protein
VRIESEFRMGAAPEEAYPLLLDLERVAPCMPGATLGAERDDGSREVRVNVRLGPMKFTYDGTVRIVERDDAARRAVLEGDARESKGQGGAKATIAMTVNENGSGSRVETVADMQLSGRAAQMGRGVVEDVAKRMIADMAACLEQRLSAPPPAAEADAPRSEAPAGDGEATAAPSPPPQSAAPVKAGSLVVRALWDRIRALFGRRT